jgi:uncharacterized damage-inducible protein DinB
MDLVAHHVRELGYNAWANRRLLDALRDAPAAPERALALMAHIAGAEWLWLRRTGQPGPELAVWPALALGDIDKHLEALAATWRSTTTDLGAAALERLVSYTNSKGEPWTSRLSDILTHVVVHSSYHRGQATQLIVAAGIQPPYTDYIECVRRGHLDQGWPADREAAAG